VECLKAGVGGWLHVHANVGTHDLGAVQGQSAACDGRWAQKLVEQLHAISERVDKPRFREWNWTFTVRHVEKVKSYAPKIWHVVADVEARPTKK